MTRVLPAWRHAPPLFAWLCAQRSRHLLLSADPQSIHYSNGPTTGIVNRQRAEQSSTSSSDTPSY